MFLSVDLLVQFDVFHILSISSINYTTVNVGVYNNRELVTVLQVDFVTRHHCLYNGVFLLMATGQDSQHDFAPAWLKLPSQDALVCITAVSTT